MSTPPSSLPLSPPSSSRWNESLRTYRHTYQASVSLTPREVARRDPFFIDPEEVYEIVSRRDGETWNRLQGHLVRVEDVTKIDRSNDQRLASLPEDLKAKAVRFLDEHDAWDTQFEVSGKGRTVYLDWNDDTDIASVNCSLRGWKLTYSQPDEVAFFSLQSKDFRRSSDFAAFIQRFQKVEVQS